MEGDQIITTVMRRRLILEALQQHKQVDVTQLSKRFDVSEVTIRKDLRYLERKNLLIRSRGGAMAPLKVGDDLSVEERKVMNLREKRAIAIAASSLILEGDTVILDSGTTLIQLAKYLNKTANLTVITNALDIAYRLSMVGLFKLIVPGGLFRKKSRSFIGVNAVENLKMYQGDKYFFSADGITREGVFTSNLEEGQIARIIINNSKENILLIDSSKFDGKGLINFAPLTRIHTLVTDHKIPKTYRAHLEALGIRVIIADNEEEVE
jgi:DeoR family transcriptional regulator of aga operon